MNVEVEKSRLLEDIHHLRLIFTEFDQVIQRAKTDENWQSAALEMIAHHKEYLRETQLTLRTLDLVNALVVKLLGRLPLEEIVFLPAPETIPMPSGKTMTLDESSLQSLIGQLNALSRHAPLALQEKIRYLLVSVHNLFRTLLSQDAQGLENALHQVNLMTSSRESQNLVREIALIARDIYTTLNAFTVNMPLDSLNESTDGMSEAVRKIRGVILRLEQAAFQNLESLETLMGSNGEMLGHLDGLLRKMREVQNQLGELKTENPALSPTISQLQDKLGDGVGAGMMVLLARANANQEGFMEMTATQGFQDLTGQTLKKIITFIESLELQMVQLLHKYKHIILAGKPVSEAPKGVRVLAESQESPHRQSQSQVDELMSELGF